MQACLPTVETETRPNPDASIIWLHGLGADGHNFEPIVSELNLPNDLAVRFVFPHAPSIPVSINGGYIMPAWYNIRQTELGIEQDEEGIRQSARSIEMLIEREQMRGVVTDRIILAGFSQGGAMALHVGLKTQTGVGNIIALSAYLLLPEQIKSGNQTTRPTSIFMAHGINDPVVPFELGDAGRRELLGLGHSVEWHTYSMQHAVCPEETRAIGVWLKRILRKPLKRNQHHLR